MGAGKVRRGPQGPQTLSTCMAVTLGGDSTLNAAPSITRSAVWQKYISTPNCVCGHSVSSLDCLASLSSLSTASGTALVMLRQRDALY